MVARTHPADGACDRTFPHSPLPRLPGGREADGNVMVAQNSTLHGSEPGAKPTPRTEWASRVVDCGSFAQDESVALRQFGNPTGERIQDVVDVLPHDAELTCPHADAARTGWVS